MCLECQLCWAALRHACIVGKCGVGRQDELTTDLELFVGYVLRFPDGVAGWVSVPFPVLFGGVPQEVDFVSRVVDVDVDGLAVNSAVNFVGRILNSPKP